jgi:hypothetical protein
VSVNEAYIRRVCKEILDLDEAILGTSIMNKSGNILTTMSKPVLERLFNLPPDIKANSGTAATMMMGMAKDMERVFGATKSIMSIHTKSILMLIPAITGSNEEELLIGLVLQPSVNIEYIFERVQKLLLSSDMLHGR